MNPLRNVSPTLLAPIALAAVLVIGLVGSTVVYDIAGGSGAKAKNLCVINGIQSINDLMPLLYVTFIVITALGGVGLLGFSLFRNSGIGRAIGLLAFLALGLGVLNGPAGHGFGSVAEAAVSDCLQVDGSNAMSADLDMGGNDINNTATLEFDGVTTASLAASPTDGTLTWRSDGTLSPVVALNSEWVDLFGGVHNVKAFGATGDGTTDDRAAFQSALDEFCVAGGDGGALYVPPGDYLIEPNADGEGLLCAGASGNNVKRVGVFVDPSARLKLGSALTGTNPESSAVAFLDVAYADYVEIAGGVWEGLGTASNSMSSTDPRLVIHLQSSIEWAHIHDITMKGWKNAIGIDPSNQGQTHIRSVHMEDVSAGIHQTNVQGTVIVNGFYFRAPNFAAGDMLNNGVVQGNNILAISDFNIETPYRAFGLATNASADTDGRFYISNGRVKGTSATAVGIWTSGDTSGPSIWVDNVSFETLNYGAQLEGMYFQFANCWFQPHSTGADKIALQLSDGSVHARRVVVDGCTFQDWTEGVDTNGGTIDALTAQGNYFDGVTTPVETTGVTSAAVRDNLGHVTENSGTATVASGTTSIAVTHGLNVTPAAGDCVVTPTNSMGTASKFYVDTYTSTQFTINVDADPGATTATFAWSCQVY